MSAPDDAAKAAPNIPLAQRAVTHVAQIAMDSLHEPMVLIIMHEKTHVFDLPQVQLPQLKRCPQVVRAVADMVRSRDGVIGFADR